MKLNKEIYTREEVENIIDEVKNEVKIKMLEEEMIRIQREHDTLSNLSNFISIDIPKRGSNKIS